MRFHLQIIMLGCIFSFMAASGCSLIEDGPAASGSSEPAAQATAAVDWRTRKSDESAVARSAATSSPEPTAECIEATDCPGLAHAARWCSPTGQCEYSCEPGFGDANAERPPNGCECRRRHRGVEQCDGIDDDCDGRADNVFAGGDLAAAPRMTCMTSRSGLLACRGQLAATWGAGRGQPDYRKVATSRRHGCALDQAGQVYCWGANRYGQTGQPAPGRVAQPTPVELGVGAVEVVVGGHHSCALSVDGQIFCWGRNDYGQLGDATVVGRARPRPVDAQLEFVGLAAGDFHTCAVSAAGRAYCWGANLGGQAGQPDTPAVDVPSPVDAAEAFVDVAAGANHTCALTGQGRAYCWGDNEDGQLGDGTRRSRPTAEPIDDAPEFVALAAGASHSCGLADTGRLYCWGDNGAGRLGVDRPLRRALRPQPAATRHRFSALAAGGAHTCGLTRPGHLYCWGEGRAGQLGPRMSATRLPRRADCPAGG